MKEVGPKKRAFNFTLFVKLVIIKVFFGHFSTFESLLRIEDMGTRIDDMEHNINDLMTQGSSFSYIYIKKIYNVG